MKRSLEEEEKYWYERLREEGFEDIEDTTKRTRPLKRWHSFDFLSETSQRRKMVATQYIRQAEEFLHSDGFEAACAWLAQRHGNRQVTEQEVRDIWELHIEGWTERKIAAELHRSKTCIHTVILQLKEWMTLS